MLDAHGFFQVTGGGGLFIQRVHDFFRLWLKRLSPEPERASIEITTYCNYSCGMCYRTAMGLESEHMSMEVFDRINTQLPRDIRQVSLSGLGEGLMHPEITEMIRRCREHHPKVSIDFTTNGALLGDRFRERLLATPVDMVTISLDAIEAAIPELGHRADARVVENVRAFARQAQERENPVRLRLQSVVFSEEQIEGLGAFARETGITMWNLIRMDNPVGSEAKRIEAERFRRIFRRTRRWARRHGIRVVSSAYHNLPMRIASHFDRLCLQYHNFLYFRVDGEVLPCCVLRDYSFGNVTRVPLAEIWGSGRARGFFDDQRRLCGHCDVWRHDYSH